MADDVLIQPLVSAGLELEGYQDRLRVLSEQERAAQNRVLELLDAHRKDRYERTLGDGSVLMIWRESVAYARLYPKQET